MGSDTKRARNGGDKIRNKGSHIAKEIMCVALTSNVNRSNISIDHAALPTLNPCIYFIMNEKSALGSCPSDATHRLSFKSKQTPGIAA
jgi:hypothetical protein